jgi:hypothetical protein
MVHGRGSAMPIVKLVEMIDFICIIVERRVYCKFRTLGRSMLRKGKEKEKNTVLP